MALLFLVKLLITVSMCSGSTLNIDFENGYANYAIKVNNETWLESGKTMFRDRGNWVNLKLSGTTKTTGYDSFGEYNKLSIRYIDVNNDHYKYETSIRQYPLLSNIIILSQEFPTGLTNASVHDSDGIISSFPSFKIRTPPSSNKILGYAEFVGSMAASHTEVGVFNINDTKLNGGIQFTGPLALYDMNNCIVISSLINHMAINLNITYPDHDEIRWGLQGNISNVNQNYNIEFIIYLTENGGGVNRGMKEWGDKLLQYHNVKQRGNSHSRDYTLNYLGYSTDNGAYYYYYTEPNKNYQQTIIDINNYHNKLNIPTKYILLDSWWYYQGKNGGVYNWSARSDIFPNGMQYIYNQTGWKIQAHNRYFSLDNIYANNIPGYSYKNNGTNLFNFTWSNFDSLPTVSKFWDYLFSINKDWGLIVYEQDWLYKTYDTIPLLQNSSDFGQQWLQQMNDNADKYDLSIQYCMSYVRHLMTTPQLKAVTQTRASGDYHPGSTQWQIGISSIFTAAIDIAPSKDSWWTMPGYQAGPYSNNTEEPYNRIQSVILSLSNGPVTFADQIGYSNRSLIMRCCNDAGLLLRPDYSGTMIDRYFYGHINSSLSIDGQIYTSYSIIGDDSNILTEYYYLFAVDLRHKYTFYPFDILGNYKNKNEINEMIIKSWIIYETNTTDKYQLFNHTNPLIIESNYNSYDFVYFTLIPILPPQISGIEWYLQGEINKWITLSKQRFTYINYNSDNTVVVTLLCVNNEILNIGFININTMKQKIVTCTCSETEQMTITMPAALCT